MITKGFVLNSLYNGKHEYSLEFSENDKELEDKRIELIQLNSEKFERFRKTENIRNEYLSQLNEILKDCNKNLFEYDFYIEKFVKDNPIPNELLEFITYIKDRNDVTFYCISEIDFEVEYYVSNLLGFK